MDSANGDKPLRKICEAFKDIANCINSENQNPQQQQLELAPFSQACSLVSPLFRCLGIAFKFAEMDYVAKVNDLCETSKSISTLQSMMQKDIEENCVRKPGSHTRNLLRVKRGLDMVRVLFEEILVSEDNSLKNPASKAYSQVFSPYHGWAIRKAVAAGMYALPTKAQLLQKLNEDEVSAKSEMQNYVTASTLVILYIDKLFQSRELGIDWMPLTINFMFTARALLDHQLQTITPSFTNHGSCNAIRCPVTAILVVCLNVGFFSLTVGFFSLTSASPSASSPTPLPHTRLLLSLQNLIYDMAKQHLVNELRYPDGCLASKYDQSFPIRGLYYDKLKGCLLKLDFFGSIEPDGCYFGRRKLSRKEIEELYGTRHIGRDQARQLVGLMDFFCFSEVCLIADIVQYFVDAKLEFDASYIYQDVHRAIQYVHRSGLVHRGVLADPQRYLVKNENGKKLVLMINSPYYFVDGGMRYMLEDSLGCGDSWRELFEVVIAKANKPDFYTSEHPFRERQPSISQKWMSFFLIKSTTMDASRPSYKSPSGMAQRLIYL